MLLWRRSLAVFMWNCHLHFKPRLHDTTGCQTGCETGFTTGCIVYTNIQPVVKPVWQPVWQPAVSCIQPVVKPVVQPGLTTGWTNSCSFNTDVKTVVKPWQPYWQPVVSCKRGISVFASLFTNNIHPGKKHPGVHRGITRCKVLNKPHLANYYGRP